jgi:imidazolonepropionase-like amidohydrolase
MRKEWFAVLALSLFGCRRAQEPVPPPDSKLLAFVGVDVVPMDHEGVLRGQTVVVRDQTIVAMGPAVELPPGTRVIDGHGKFLMPGLADMHAHLLRESDLMLYLARGVTTVRNMWGAPVHLDWREGVARGHQLGPTIYTAGPIVDGDPPVHDGSLVVTDAASADRAIALHKKLGYDFVKVYSNLSLPAYEHLVAAAKRAGLAVVGHVPRAVGLGRAIDAGQRSVEHLTAFSEAVQKADSPVAGKFDRASRTKKLDWVDDAKIPLLAAHIRDRGTFICPTRVVMTGDESPSALNARLHRWEMKFVGDYDRVIWESEVERPAERVALDAKNLAFGDRMIGALLAQNARIVVGTDTGNPFVIPGFSVHEELELLVHDGLSPYQALVAATRAGAELLGKEDFGVVAVGKRADLLLLDGNPLTDVRAADRIAAVVARGRLLDRPELDHLLTSAAQRVHEDHPFAPAPSIADAVFDATYAITFRGAAFGEERIAVSKKGPVEAQSFDPHSGQTTTALFQAGRMSVDSNGPMGAGHAVVDLFADKASIDARLLSGVDATLELAMDDDTILDASGFLAGRFLLLPELRSLDVGAQVELRVAEVSFGSSLAVPTKKLVVRRVAPRRFEMGDATLTLDDQGYPIAYEVKAFGDVVHFDRR